MNYSPLRYPGGKNRLTPLVKILMEEAGIVQGTYVEPFVGGGGVALSLLLNKVVTKIVINDYDISIFSVWFAILNDTEVLIDLIKNAKLSVEEWRIQKEILSNKNKEYSVELAFATLYLNRTNRSGILKAGPIGGYDQRGNYKIDARFKKEKIIDKINEIAKHREKIELYNLDAKVFIKDILPKITNSFTYLDPPYYNKGKELYCNFLRHHDHQQIAQLVLNIHTPWMITYDDVPEIEDLYKGKNVKRFDINYSVANKGKKSEIIALSSDYWPPKDVLDKMNKNIR